MSTPFKAPFSGKCIHGKDGAQMVKGVLANPKCDRCTAVALTKERA